MTYWRKGSKYRNQTVKDNGVLFGSKKEHARYQALKILEQAGQIQNLKAHPRFKLEVAGFAICTYVADAQYEDAGALVVEDVKALDLKTGLIICTPEAKLKHKLFQALYPQYEFRIYA